MWVVPTIGVIDTPEIEMLGMRLFPKPQEMNFSVSITSLFVASSSTPPGSFAQRGASCY
jgi:hypothetical protein